MASSSSSNLIFVLPAGLTFSGVTTWTLALAGRLAAQGRPVKLIQHANFGPQLEMALPPAVERVNCRNQSLPDRFYTKADVAAYALDYQPLLPGTIIPNGAPGTYATCALLSRRRPEALRVIGYAHSDEAVYYEWLTTYAPIIHKFVAVSQEIAAKLTQLLPERAADISVLPYAVAADPQLTRRYSPAERPLQLMYAGRIVEAQKRVSDLLRLAQALVAAQVDFHLRLVGDGPALPDLHRTLHQAEPNLRRRVTLVGPLAPARMAATWQIADVCLLVSDYEGTSVAMLEAMAQGCVPLVTAVSGTAAVIEQGRNGFSVPVGDIAGLVEIIKRLVQDREMVARVGAAAHQTARTGYGYDGYLRQFLAVVDQAWQQPPRAWPEERPLSPQPTVKEIVQALSGEELSRAASLQTLIKATGFKLIDRPGLRWLYHFRKLGKIIFGG